MRTVRQSVIVTLSEWGSTRAEDVGFGDKALHCSFCAEFKARFQPDRKFDNAVIAGAGII